MARRDGPSLRVLGKKEIEREKMGGLAVNSGSVRPRSFSSGVLPVRAKGTAVLVGKGITFDSGGISIKPAPSMGR
jgi:leucyl aminopeptidase